jgi:3-methyladenine DNA glycosylase AlkD
MQAAANPAHAASMQRFFKEEVNCLGIPSKAYKALLKPFAAEVKQMPKTKVWQLCEELRKSGVMEEGGAAAEFCMAQQKNFMPDDIEVFEHWIDTFIRDWASCDAFCGHAVGTLIVKYPEAAERTLLWAKSPLPYTRRAAAVSYTGIAKDCGYPDYVFRIADLLLTDKEDIVQKGYGWMLKVASAKHTQEVFAYVCRNKAVMPRTALRYAIEKMPPEMRKIAMEK